MVAAQPHYLLFCDTYVSEHSLAHAAQADVNSGECNRTATCNGGFGRWHFVLERLDGPERLEAADGESGVNAERLALLSVVRGLEALEQPSQVTMVTTSRYVSRGLRYGLNSWRDSGYTWERFGVQKPIRNSDLWRRIDGAMQFHGVTCRLIQAPQPVPQIQAACLAADTPPAVQAGVATAVHVEPVGPIQEPRQHTSAELGPSPLGPRVAGAHVTGTHVTGTHAAGTHNGNNSARDAWWQVAAGWSKWLKGRSQHRPAFAGT